MACHIRSEVPDVLVGDPGRLRQVIINLLGNAIKFTESGEVVMLVKPEKPPEYEPSPSCPESALPLLAGSPVGLKFEVRDTGIGIARGKQALIFEAFAQADASTTRKHGGTGLGLSISSHLVGLMGGRIWLESELGQGSTFHFTVQLSVGTSNSQGFAHLPLSLHDMRVLVVDDNATNRRILEEVLLGWKMRPTAVDGAAAGLAELRQGVLAGDPYPLVLLDAHMPGTDGFTLACQIRQGPALASATLVMLTSAGRTGDGVRCQELGIAAYLMKPIKQSELLATLLTALDEARRNATAPSVPPPLAPERRPLRILLVEDNIINQKLGMRLLEKKNHIVVVANNGRECLERWKQDRFDLILMDVQMPEMDGLEATRLIRSHEQQTGGHVLILAMTAHAMKGDRERCLSAGMDGYLTKPIQPQELYETLERLFGVKETKRVGVKMSEMSPAE